MLRRLNKIPKCITFRQIVRNLCTPDDGPPPKKPSETDDKSGQTETSKKPKNKVLRKKNEKCPPKIKRSQVGATQKQVKKVEKRSLPEVPLKAPYWRNVSLGVVAFIVCFTGYTFATIKEHGREPFVAYEYMRIRNKPYFFGDGSRTLFHNPKVNALKDGYEDEEN